MDFLEIAERRDGYFIWTDAHDRAVFPVQIVDVVYSVPAQDGQFERESGEFCA
jgi:hypothetical protein